LSIVYCLLSIVYCLLSIVTFFNSRQSADKTFHSGLAVWEDSARQLCSRESHRHALLIPILYKVV
jgi:hypothetical protein